MSKNILRLGFFFLILLLMANSIKAEEKNVLGEVEQLMNELKEKGISEDELRAIKKPVTEMLKMGVKREDLRNTIVELSKRDIKGKEFRNVINSMNDLVKGGEDPKVVGSIVSQTVHQAQAEGLKGEELAKRVHEAIRKRKMEKEAMRKELKKQERKTKGGFEKKEPRGHKNK